MRKLLFVFLLLPGFCYAQTVVETVKLKNEKFATLYDDGTWRYTSMPTPLTKTTSDATRSLPQPIKQTPSQETNAPSNAVYSATCGARTKAGGACKRVVKGGGRCWQHS